PRVVLRDRDLAAADRRAAVGGAARARRALRGAAAGANREREFVEGETTMASVRAAAIQMTSGRDVAANLEQARALLRDAAGQGAELAVLPENFSFLGARDADRLAAAEEPGR